jgi:hypothetical protein
MAITGVSFSGPLFDEPELLDQMTKAIQDTVGDDLFVKWESLLEENIRHSGPIYQSFIQVKDTPDGAVVNDGWEENNELPYGPWLEGVGSRNSPVTRFPGYFSLRDAGDETEEQLQEIAQPVVDEYLERINGD